MGGMAAALMLALGALLWRIGLWGAGDAKWLAVLAGHAGPDGVWPLLCWTLLAGGVLALVWKLALLSAELRLGVTRAQALRHLAQRTGVEEIRAFATLLVHTERLGTGVTDALRVHAQALRQQRERRAEEAAARLPVKLLFPLIFALFPALLVVLMGPALISLMRQLAPLVAG